ncbi:MAG: oxygen-independent coproporphyrinogen-3 oxidase, partial [Mariniblastus sp.]
WETKRAWLDYAYEEFLGAGYKISSAYTVVKDNNKVNFSYRDNLWQGSDLLATGIASFGHVSGVHYQNKADMKEYQADLMEHNRLPLGRALKPTPHQLLVREMILLLKRGFLDVGYFKNKYNVDITAHWKNEFEQHAQDGMLVIGPERIELTRKGFLHADAMLPPFFEAEHQGIRYT